MAEIKGRAIGWDEEVDFSNNNEVIVLEPGDYDFTVWKVEHKQYPGSARIGECDQAVVTIQVKSSGGNAFVTERFLLWDTLMWKIASFGRCIGIASSGKHVMPWSKLAGNYEGRAKIIRDEYTGTDGKVHVNNKVERWIPKNDSGKTEADEWDD